MQPQIPPTKTSQAHSKDDALAILTDFSRDLGTLTELGSLSVHIASGLSRCADCLESELFVLDREKDIFRRTVSRRQLSPTESWLTIPATHPLPRQLASDHLIVSRSSLTSSPHREETGTAASVVFDDLSMQHCIPLISKNRVIGFCLLGGSRRSSLDATTHALLTAVAQNAANALDNAMLNEDLRRSQTLMRRTDRLRSLEIIAGGFAHEIRNPLTSIKTFIQLAPERKDDAEFIREFSKVVLDDVYRIERLIQEILDYARYMEPKLTEEDLNEIVTSCVYFIGVKAESRRVKIEKALANDLPRVMLDRQQIKQVILNLLLNAMDAMAERGGTLSVRTHRLLRADGQPWSQIEVKDTGHGISAENLEHIFDPFFTTKHESGEHEGTGLGLTIAHQIIQEHHGDIHIESREGTGTTFFINIPASPLGTATTSTGTV